MRFYETLYLFRPDLPEEEGIKLQEKIRNVITRNKGILIKEEPWGKRDLAYPVDKYMQGYYVLLNYAGEPGISFELEREFRLDERVLKHNTLKIQDRYIPEQGSQPQEDLKRTVTEVAPDEAPQEKGD